MMTTLLVVDHVVLVEAEAVVGVQGPLDVLVQLVHGVRVLARRRVGVADQLPALVGQLDLLLLLVEVKCSSRIICVASLSAQW